MEAKDIIISWERMRMIYQECEVKGIEGLHATDKICEAQAEITAPIFFKAGMEYGDMKAYESGVHNGEAEGLAEGIREVVGWIEKEYGYFTDDGLAKIIIDDGGYYGRPDSIAKYQAQKKEWGI